MDPIRRCTNDIDSCHREDGYAREKLDEVIAQNRGAKPASSQLTPNGAGYAAAKAEWSATRGGMRIAPSALPEGGYAAGKEWLAKRAEKQMHHGLKAVAERAKSATVAKAAQVASKGLHALGFILTVWEGVKLTTEAHEGAVNDAKEQAQREMDGLNRDAMRAFILGGTGDVFKPEYRAFLMQNVSKESKEVAGKMVTHASVDQNQRYATEKIVIQAMAREGIKDAKALGINSQESLEKALRSDSKFREHFETSTAFRMGVGSVIFDAERKVGR